MKAFLRKTLPLLLALMLLLSLVPGALAEGDAPSDSAPADAEQTLPAEEPDGTGIIDGEALTQWVDALLAEHQITGSLQDFSVGFCYTGTGDCWFYDADVFMYSASLYKVPAAMLVSEKEAAGELTQDSVIMGNTLQYLESTALTFSSNESGHALVDYMGGTYAGKCADQITRYASLPESYYTENYYQYSYYTARFMTQLMKTLFDGGDEQFPHIIEYLLPADPDSYMHLTLKDRYQVAQKYGAYQEGPGKNNNHIASIIYTPTPIIVVVMTRNVPNYQNLMAEVGEHLADYSLELDKTVEELKRQQAEAEAAAAAEVPEAPQAEAPAAGTPDGQSQSPAVPSTRPQGKLPWIIAAVAATAAVATAALVLAEKKNGKAASQRRKPKH